MKNSQEKNDNIKIIITAIFMALFIFIVTNGTRILKNSTDVVVVSNGSLLYEEPAEGYVLRDEVVLQGENFKNGMVQTVSDGKRVAKNQIFFRYYSNNEDTIMKQMNELDKEINNLIETSDFSFVSSDISSIEKQIETILDSMYGLNDLQKIQENKNKIDAYISKKAQIKGVLSPENSYLKTLTEQRNDLAKQLENGSEIVYANRAGIASYRVDGLEEILKVDNFDYLSTELLNGFDLKVGASIPQNAECGKIVDNFYCYIASSINTEKALTANIGDKVTLRLSNSKEIEAEIVYIKDEEKNRIIVFKTEDNIEDLLEYRKISYDIIWWKYTGWKISNSCLIEIDDKMYVEKSTAGYVEKILVKVLRQNDTYSIVRNYEDDELRQLGYSEDEISEMTKIKLYDEINSH